MSFNTVTLGCIADRLEMSRRVMILCHTGPDGDAVGSSTALALMCEAMGKEVICVAPDKLAERLEFIMPERFRAEYTDALEDSFDTVIAVDTASPAQLGGLSHLAENGKVHLMIDHHGVGEPYADSYIDPYASATGEIMHHLYVLLRERGLVGVMPDVSRAIYVAVVSDTGSFKFSNTTPNTHLIAASLVGEINSAEDGGMTTDELCRNLFGRRTMRDIKAQGLAIEKLRVFADGELGAVLLTADEYLSRGLEESDLSMAVETPRSLAGVKIAIAVRQKADERDTFKVSSRSNCDACVSEVCALFGGGGHPKAAGCTIYGTDPEEVLLEAVRAFASAIGKDI